MPLHPCHWHLRSRKRYKYFSIARVFHVMFSKRRSSKKLDVGLYATFRQNHPDVSSGTSAPIHLSVTESESFIRSTCEDEVDTQCGDMNFTPTSGVPCLSSKHVVSVVPMTLMPDESVSRRTPVAQRYKAEEHELPTVVGSSPPEHDVWSDFILPEYLSDSKAFRSCDFQDFPSPLFPPISVPETLVSASPGIRPLPPCASEILANSNNVDAVRSLQFDIGDTFCVDTSSTESDLSVQPLSSNRFRHRLDTPPALMLKGSGEVTYLNKGSHYSISVEDGMRAGSSPIKKLYCTSVQVVFDAEQQRQQPLTSWHLWEQNRGDEAVRSYEGKSLAIEYINPQESDHQDPATVLRVTHSDGFSLMWSAEPSDLTQFSVGFRLNFRSTDFSICKGVIGVAMRLCTRSEEISTTSVHSLIPNVEMSYCRIKAFRSHGAERKRANDLVTVEKRTRKLKQQLAHLQTRWGPKDKKPDMDENKLPRLPGARRYHADGLYCKLKTLQLNCTSAQPYTFLGLREEKQQDCDWLPSAREHRSPGSLEAGSTSLSSNSRSSSVPLTSRPTQLISSSHSIQRPIRSWNDTSHQTSMTRDGPERTENRAVGHKGTKVACFYILRLASNIQVRLTIT